MKFRLEWEIDIDAASPKDAAIQARRYQLDESAQVGFFTVQWEEPDGTFKQETVDLDTLEWYP